MRGHLKASTDCVIGFMRGVVVDRSLAAQMSEANPVALHSGIDGPNAIRPRREAGLAESGTTSTSNISC